ncbi:hypothetical protein Nmel_013633 [Mimus melanotis]
MPGEMRKAEMSHSSSFLSNLVDNAGCDASLPPR